MPPGTRESIETATLRRVAAAGSAAAVPR